jgi:hypothetical protein
MNADVLTTRVAGGIAVITLGSAKRIYFDEEMGDALTEALDGFAGDANVRVVVVTGGAPGYFIRHFSVAALIRLAESLRASGREWPENATYNGGFFDKAMALCESMSKPVIAVISGSRSIVVEARSVNHDWISGARAVFGEEKNEWWERADAAYSNIPEYRARAALEIPLLFLEPLRAWGPGKIIRANAGMEKCRQSSFAETEKRFASGMADEIICWGFCRRKYMKIPEPIGELIAKAPFAHLTTLNSTGDPQVTVVWVGIENEEFVIGHLTCLLTRRWKIFDAIRE